MKHTRLFRSIAFLLALTLLPAPAHAVEQIYFTAVNITIMPLTADTMPVWIDGVYHRVLFDPETQDLRFDPPAPEYWENVSTTPPEG